MKKFFPAPLSIMGLIAAAMLASACADQKSATSLDASSLDSGIVGGEPVVASDEIAKSTVALGSSAQGVFCSGVLIAKNLVVTAGHCTGATMTPSEMNVIFGTDLRGKLQSRKVLGGKVTKQWPELKEDQEKNWGDIAVLRFEGEAPAGYVPARLLESADQLKRGMDVVLAGYGLASMSPQEDPEKLMKASVKLTNPKYSETELKFSQFKGKGACHGDSGGPAYALVNKQLFLIGVTSRSATADGAGTCLEGSIYTSIPGQIAFVKSASDFLNSKDFVPNQKIPQPSTEM